MTIQVVSDWKVRIVYDATSPEMAARVGALVIQLITSGEVREVELVEA